MQTPARLSAMLAAAPKPKPKPKPLPGYPVRVGLDAPTQWGKGASWDPTTLPGSPKPPRPPKKPKPSALLAQTLGRGAR